MEVYNINKIRASLKKMEAARNLFRHKKNNYDNSRLAKSHDEISCRMNERIEPKLNKINNGYDNTIEFWNEFIEEVIRTDESLAQEANSLQVETQEISRDANRNFNFEILAEENSNVSERDLQEFTRSLYDFESGSTEIQAQNRYIKENYPGLKIFYNPGMNGSKYYDGSFQIILDNLYNYRHEIGHVIYERKHDIVMEEELKEKELILNKAKQFLDNNGSLSKVEDLWYKIKDYANNKTKERYNGKSKEELIDNFATGCEGARNKYSDSDFEEILIRRGFTKEQAQKIIEENISSLEVAKQTVNSEWNRNYAKILTNTYPHILSFFGLYDSILGGQLHEEKNMPGHTRDYFLEFEGYEVDTIFNEMFAEFNQLKQYASNEKYSKKIAKESAILLEKFREDVGYELYDKLEKEYLESIS